MTAWNIKPAGVQAVLVQVQSDSEALGAAFNAIDGAQESLNGGSGATAAVTAAQNCQVHADPILAPVAAAMIDLINSQEARLTGIANRIQACGLGAGEATLAYYHGDQQMAATTQAAAISAAASGDLSFFGNR